MNPRAATNDLLPFQGSPFGQLGYFSKMPAYYTRYTFLTHSSFVVICLNLLSCACAPSRKTKGSPFNSELPKRRGWDSNPRALSDKRFSRPPRYDHFDTSPNVLFYFKRYSRFCQALFSLFFNLWKVSKAGCIRCNAASLPLIL